jgi:hypothetical protein
MITNAEQAVLYRGKAELLRSMADDMSQHQNRLALLDIAKEYDAMAERAESRVPLAPAVLPGRRR